MNGAPRPNRWNLFIPKLVTALGEGYGLKEARADVFAGLTVAVIALPLSLALAVASGVSPGRGLFTAVVAGVIVSALGGSRYQIAGPTGAFVVVVAGIVQQSGYEGLVVATAMAGVLLVLTGFSGLGTYIKYVPFPVTTGFTAGIAVVIFAGQVGEFMGLDVRHASAGAIGSLGADAAAIATLLTVFVDLSLAIAVGIVLAALVFTRDMSLATRAVAVPREALDDVDDLAVPDDSTSPREMLPRGVEVFRLHGAFFFAAAVEFEELLSRSGDMPKVLILVMKDVPLIDASGAVALKRFIATARSKGIATVLSELNPQPEAALRNMDVAVPRAGSFRDSIAVARAFLPRDAVDDAVR